ncbi:MAG: 16S rRNA (cytosine(1402)-N(4))-methyltransferase RsmH [Gemmatimonadaceae bacterium]|nr:16S rRNA (cytosine(1402)-N(4))-methyltransferase RsmH [Gemmatimonadaceae bacterium]MCW5824945.1 16S rRNA (cytosine(1402)-N(4))-methyltransferase RsmH [Gemmatimonadaceae bacterium]
MTSASDAKLSSHASAWHAPVLVAEVCAALDGVPQVLDGTLGGGGHAEALLERGHRVTGIDRDPQALAIASERLARFADSGAFRALQGNHDRIDDIAALAAETFDGILLDLGVSSRQLDDDARGFSFREGVALDMRMDPNGAVTAADWLNDSDEATLAGVFKSAGDEPKARRLAREIVHRRERRPFATSDDLVGAIRAVLGPRSGPGDFARLFQAVRIAVNEELEGLAAGLVTLRNRLVPGGVLAVIAYHSGEDRVVKHLFREWSTACTCPPRQPMCTCGGVALGETLTRKPVLAGEAEVALNPRARSAHLRVWRRAGGEG